MSKYTIHCSETADLHLKRFIFDGLDSYAEEKTGKTAEIEPLYLSIEEEGKPIAGLIAFTFWKTIQVDQLYVDKNVRCKGMGKTLMDKVMHIGKERGCLMMTVETMDFQAVDFYKKLGFSIDFARSGYEDNRTLYFFSKKL